MLAAEEVTVRYGAQEAVSGLSLHVRSGEWWMVVGPNGAGKTTLAGVLGRSVPFEGRVTLEERDIRSFSPQEYARKVGVLSQNHTAVYGFTVEEVVRLGRYARRGGFLRGGDPDAGAKLESALALTGLSSMRSRNMTALSGGELQRVFLAQVLCQDPEILILDEPANHLDLPFQQELFTLVSSWLQVPGRAVVTVMHDLSLAMRYGSHALLMDRGRCVAEGKVRDVLSSDNLRKVYGMDVHAWMRGLLAQWEEC